MTYSNKLICDLLVYLIKKWW